MIKSKEHISICICTYKRPELLAKLLEKITIQETENLFTISVVIVDNDSKFSAKPIVDQFVKRKKLKIEYTQVSERNFALVRNISVEKAIGDYIAFIDDDEYPINNWLLLLYKTIQQYRVSGALGPVVPEFKIKPPKWAIKGKMFSRTRLKTGTFLQWWYTRTGNALLKREMFLDPDNLFDLKFSLGGEDVTLFEKLIDKGYTFVWCDEAVAYEEVPENRLKVSYLLKRAKLRGYITYFYYKDTRPWINNFQVLIKSIFTSFIYIFLMPFYLIIGYHRFVDLLIRFIHHITIIKTFFGLLKIDERNI